MWAAMGAGGAVPGTGKASRKGNKRQPFYMTKHDILKGENLTKPHPFETGKGSQKLTYSAGGKRF
jgi:hypothetical protein